MLLSHSARYSNAGATKKADLSLATHPDASQQLENQTRRLLKILKHVIDENLVAALEITDAPSGRALEVNHVW